MIETRGLPLQVEDVFPEIPLLPDDDEIDVPPEEGEDSFWPPFMEEGKDD